MSGAPDKGEGVGKPTPYVPVLLLRSLAAPLRGVKMTDDSSHDPYAAVLADLERQRDQINSDIAMIRRRMGLSMDEAVQSAAGTFVVAGPEPSEVRPDSFIGMSIRDAITKYLSMVKRPKKTAEIARALEEGGLQHFSKRWFATVQTTLKRMISGGVVVRVPNGWGLQEWYPGRNFEKKEPRRKKKPAKKATKQNDDKSAPDARKLVASRRLQGHYLGLLRKVPEAKRGAYKAIAKQEGREQAIRAMTRDLNS